MARLGVECDFPMFLPLQMMLFPMPWKLQNGLSFSPFCTIWGVLRGLRPPFLSPWTPKLHLCTLVPMPGTPFSHTPKHHLGCPILPFGMSHFAIWGIPFHHLGYFNACLCPHIGERFTLSLRWFSHFWAKIAYKRMFKPAVERKSDSKPSNNCQLFS